MLIYSKINYIHGYQWFCLDHSNPHPVGLIGFGIGLVSMLGYLELHIKAGR